MNLTDTPDLKIIIKTRLPALNEHIANAKKTAYVNRGKIRYRKDNMKSEFTAICRQAAKAQSGGLKFNNIFLSFMWFESNKRRDPDNLIFGKKYILDGFVDAGLIPNDGWKNIEGFGGESWTVDKNNPRVEVSIWER